MFLLDPGVVSWFFKRVQPPKKEAPQKKKNVTTNQKRRGDTQRYSARSSGSPELRDFALGSWHRPLGASAKKFVPFSGKRLSAAFHRKLFCRSSRKKQQVIVGFTTEGIRCAPNAHENCTNPLECPRKAQEVKIC